MSEIIFFRLLGRAQNCPVNLNQDIMTITGFMSASERESHLWRYIDRARQAGQWDV